MTYTPSQLTRFLTGLSTLLLVATIGFGVFLVAGAVAGFGPSGNEVAIHTQVATDNVAGLPQDAVAPDDVEVTVRVHDATLDQHRLAAARDLAPSLVSIAVIWLLRALLRSVRDGNPFADANVKRLRALALVFLVGVPVAATLGSVFASELAATAGLDSAGVLVTVPGNGLLGGLALFVLAEVFAAGVRLRDDLEGTV